MAIVDKESLVKFGYGFDSSTSKETGMISFDPSSQAIYVGNNGEAVLVTSSVKDAKFENSVLTITKVGGETVTLDFSDVASADQTSKILGTLRTDVTANANAISSLEAAVDTSIKALDAAYKLADSSIRTDFEAADTAINNKIGTVAEGKTVVGLIEEAKAAANAAHSVVAKDSSFLTLTTSEDATSGAITYTLGTSDVASASALAEVKDTADAAAKQTDLTDHTENGAIHVTTQQKTDWQNATNAINAFLADNDASNTALDTLKEIQDFLTSDDGTVETLLGKVDNIEKSLEEGGDTANAIAAAQNAADKAQNEVDALDGVVATKAAQSDLTAHTTDGDIHVTTDDKAKWNAAEKNAKDYAKTYADGLASNYDASGAAAGALTSAKAYADDITVNGQTQSNQEITLTGVNIKVGGTGTHQTSNIDVAIEDLYTKVQAASEAGVQSLAVNADSSKYAEVDKASGAVTLTIKKVALTDASATNTGVADAWDVKESIRVAKEGAISTVQGVEGDASTAATVAGAKAYADAQIAANALKWNVLS